MQVQLRPGDDDGAPGVVHALAEQVLAEAPLLAAKQVGQRLESVVVAACDGSAAPPVVHERVHRFLQHALLVADDNLRRAQVYEALQPVVAVDDAAVEVVQVARGEASAVQLHHRAQLRRQNRERGHDHPLRHVAALAERLHDAHPLDSLLAPLSGSILHLLLQAVAERVEVEPFEDFQHRFRAHRRLERGGVAVAQLAATALREQVADGEGFQLAYPVFQSGFQLGLVVLYLDFGLVYVAFDYHEALFDFDERHFLRRQGEVALKPRYLLLGLVDSGGDCGDFGVERSERVGKIARYPGVVLPAPFGAGQNQIRQVGRRHALVFAGRHHFRLESVYGVVGFLDRILDPGDFGVERSKRGGALARYLLVVQSALFVVR